jgi:hypothetical protein
MQHINMNLHKLSHCNYKFPMTYLFIWNVLRGKLNENVLFKTEIRKEKNWQIIILLLEQACSLANIGGTMWTVHNNFCVIVNTFLMAVI